MLPEVRDYDALRAASHGAVFIGAGALAEALLGDRQHELLARAQFRVCQRRAAVMAEPAELQ